MSSLDVSVVMPTSLRRSPEASLRSAVQQQGVEMEVIVVADAPPERLVEHSLSLRMASQVLATGGGAGAGAARQMGVSSARGRYIAYLDDDDLWLPGKLAAQVRAADAMLAGRAIVSCRARQFRAGSSSSALSVPVPRNVYHGAPGNADALGRYLFFERRLAVDRNSIFLPTLLVSSELARRVPWDRSLVRHQDWDWLLRAVEHGGQIRQLDDVFCHIAVGSIGSVSATMDWRPSSLWAESLQMFVSREVLSDFYAGQVLRYSLGARSMTGLLATIRGFHRYGSPSAASLVFGLSGAIPRRLLERIALLPRPQKVKSFFALFRVPGSRRLWSKVLHRGK